jgi:uncharacterized lipoprotein
MKSIKITLMLVLIAIFAVCSESNDKKQSDSDSGKSSGINWTRYDAGLEMAAVGDKYLLIYFWRDG